MSVDGVDNSLIGASLKAARETLKLSIADVSSQLHLSEKQIRALEQDDFESFGSAMLARGFIKNYARLLSLDHEPLLEIHRKTFPEDQIQSISYQTENVAYSKAPNLNKSKVLIAGILLILILASVIVYKVIGHQSVAVQSESVAPEAEANVQGGAELMPDASLPAAERVTEDNTTTVTEVPLPAAPEATKPQAQKTETNKLQDKTVEQAPVVKPESPKVATLNTGLVKAKLVFTGPSWISVQDKTGQTVFSKLSKAGTEEFVEGVPPLKFHIGNVSATQIIFNGQSVDLTPNTYNNMARITLGDH